jgi:hypothetical protein
MRFLIAFACLTLLFVPALADGLWPQATAPQTKGTATQSTTPQTKGTPPQATAPQASARYEKPAVFSFAGLQYFHRFTKADQHEYTPLGQEDLKAWADMVTILFYPTTKDTDALFVTAKTVLENYKAAKAVVKKIDSFPKAPEKPTEHLIVVVFGRPGFIEVAFSRFSLHDGIGNAVVYSHRIYGTKVGNEMSAWLEKNGPATEKELMKWDALPTALAPK